MKKALLSITLILITVTGYAIEVPGDSTGVFETKKYNLNDTSNVITMSKVTDHNKSYEPSDIAPPAYENNDNEVERQLSEVFSFPFSGYINKDKKKNKFEPHWAGVGFGFCNVMNNNMRFIDNQQGLSVNFARSFEIFWNIFNLHYSFRNKHWGVVSGLGLDWRNYVMDKDHKFTRKGNEITIEKIEQDIRLEYSRLKTLDLTIPLLIEWQTAGRAKLFFSFGPVIGIKTYSSLKNIYTANGVENKYFERGLNPNPVNVDFLLQGGFCNIGLYVKYSPFNIFQKNYAPQMNSFSTGIMFVF